MRKLLWASMALLLSAVAALAEPTGTYRVAGSNPTDGSKYSGTVTVQKTGDTYKVTWVISGSQYDGTGIGFNDFLAVSYASGSDTGLALYGQQADGGWKGVWTYAGSRKLGVETWTKQ
jgi:hypothetical protein